MNGEACNDVNSLCRSQGKYVGALSGFIPTLVAVQLRVLSFPSEETTGHLEGFRTQLCLSHLGMSSPALEPP